MNTPQPEAPEKTRTEAPKHEPDPNTGEPAMVAGAWIPVVLGQAYHYGKGAIYAELIGPEERAFPVWISWDEAVAIQSVRDGAYSPLRNAPDLLAGLMNQLGGRVEEARLVPGTGWEVQCRLIVVQRGRRIEALCRPGDGAVLAARFGAPMRVESGLFHHRAGRSLPSLTWTVEEVTPETLTMSRVTFSFWSVLRSFLWEMRSWLVGGVALSTAGIVLERPTMISVGMIPLIQVLGFSVWRASLRETWKVADNALEVQRTLFGVRSVRRIVGGRLYVAATIEPGAQGHRGSVVNRLWVVERGRPRKIASEVTGDDVHQMARFLSLHTGWPLDKTGTEPGSRTQV